MIGWLQTHLSSVCVYFLCEQKILGWNMLPSWSSNVSNFNRPWVLFGRRRNDFENRVGRWLLYQGGQTIVITTTGPIASVVLKWSTMLLTLFPRQKKNGSKCLVFYSKKIYHWFIGTFDEESFYVNSQPISAKKLPFLIVGNKWFLPLMFEVHISKMFCQLFSIFSIKCLV